MLLVLWGVTSGVALTLLTPVRDAHILALGALLLPLALALGLELTGRLHATLTVGPDRLTLRGVGGLASRTHSLPVDLA